MSEGERPQFLISSKSGTESVHVVPPMQKGPENTETPVEFKQSIFAKKPEDISKIKTDSLRRKVGLLHDAFVEDPNLLDVVDLEKEENSVKDKMESGEYPEEEAKPVWRVLKGEIKRRREEKSKDKEQSPSLDEMFSGSSEAAKTVGAAIAGAAVAEGIDAVQSAIGKGLGRADSGGSENVGVPKQPEIKTAKEKSYSEMNYTELNRVLNGDDISGAEKEEIEKEISNLITSFYDYKIDNDRLLDRLRDRAFVTVKYNPWDRVYEALVQDGEEQERFLRQSSGDNPRWEGIVRGIFRAEAARVALSGIQNKIRNDPEGYTEEWKRKNNVTDEQRARFQDQVREGVFELLPYEPSQLVGMGLEGAPSDLARDLVQQEVRTPDQIRADREEYEKAMAPIPPAHIVAIFREGRYKRYENAWKDSVEFFNIMDTRGRLDWAYLNIGVFNQGIIPDAARSWKNLLDNWLGDLNDAARLAKLNPQELRQIAETQKDIVAMMAVSSSARAMEQSDGGASEYVAIITQSQSDHPDYSKQDTWAEFLLADDPAKYARLVQMELVKKYYEKIKMDAGITVTREAGEDYEDRSSGRPKVKTTRVSEFTTDIDAAQNGKLVKYLRTKGTNPTDPSAPWEYKGGFDAYIREELLNGEVDTIHRSAAKLAADAFLVEKFTRWEMAVTQSTVEEENEIGFKKNEFALAPFVGWGGDPFRMTEEPSVLPRWFKDKYQGPFRVVLTMFDNAFSPRDIFVGDKKDKMVRGTGIAHLKKFYRLNAAMMSALGGPTAGNLPNFSPKAIQEEIPAIADLVFQVYSDSEISGAIMARLLNTKALALTLESQRPGAREFFKVMFQGEAGRPFFEAEKLVWGENLDAKSGVLASLAGGRSQLRFKGNPYGAEANIKEIWDLLSSNDQDPKGRGRMALANRIGFGLDVIQAIATGGKQRR